MPVPKKNFNPWIGFDLDGTLAHYDKFQGIDHIGEPIAPMIDILKGHLANGDTCKIFTARVANCPEARDYILAWLYAHGLPQLEIVCVKNQGMARLYDDRAVSVGNNTGKCCDANDIPSYDSTEFELKDVPQSNALKNQVGGNHYSRMVIQPVEYCQLNQLNTMESSCIKYVSRHKHKNGIEDIRKAIHCLELIIDLEYT